MLNRENKNIIIKRLVIDLLIFVLLLASDLISKDLIMNRLNLNLYVSYPLVDGLFSIYPCLNDGASFSAFSGQKGFLIALTSILTVAIMALMIVNLIKKPKTSMLFRWSMLLILAGGLGNLVDRIFCDGMVRDFIQYAFLDKIFQKVFNSHFGVGNIADIYLVLGVFLISAYIIFDYKEGDLGLLKFKTKKEPDQNGNGEMVSDGKSENSDELQSNTEVECSLQNSLPSNDKDLGREEKE